ncbi:hypothetical protein PVK06_035291 [Gossypium arboreum]|uniref:Uncharacterized protein n=1 Tax=Gossypium arboreum TaxID=29729 RepID=A0ABR0NGF7_GOSAR|nr:hypothetical protein PVK06_035291 [Gossypium arboreum]
MVTPSLGKYGLTYFSIFTSPLIFTQASHIAPHFSICFYTIYRHFFAPPPLSPSFYSPTYHTMTIPMPTMFATPIKSPYFLPSMYETQYTYRPMVSQMPSLFYQGEPSSQPHVRRIEETRWQPRSTLQSTMDEGEEDKGPKSQHVPEGRGDFEDEEDE